MKLQQKSLFITKISIALWALFFILIPGLAASQNQSQTEEVQNFDSKITINKDALISVVEIIDYYFPSPRHGIYRNIPIICQDSSGRRFQLKLMILKISDSQGADIPYSDSKNKNNLEIKIGDPDQTVFGLKKYQIEYSVTGAINYFATWDELYWNVTGNDWKVPIRKATAEVIVPELATSANIKARCFSGSGGSPEENCQSNIKNHTVSFSADGLLTIVVGWNKGIVAQIEKDYLYTGIESGWFFVITLATILLLIFLLLKYGRDPKKITTIAPEFEPPTGLAISEMGAILNERIDPTDLTAQIIAWATDGLIKIKELPRESILKGKDWQLSKLKDLSENAKEFQKLFFNHFFSSGAEVRLSDLKMDAKYFKGLFEVKEKLYQGLVTDGYFPANPDQVRKKYLWIGIISAIVGTLMGIIAQSLTLAAAIDLSGAAVIIFSFFMPAKTLKGSEALQKILGFKEFISKVEKYRTHWAEKENIFLEFLPYAILFGVGDKWARVFKDIWREQPDWYQGDWSTFNTVVFVSSLNSFSASWSASTGSGAAGGASGFSGGGGFGGGGFGGGGGGSW